MGKNMQRNRSGMTMESESKELQAECELTNLLQNPTSSQVLFWQCSNHTLNLCLGER